MKHDGRRGYVERAGMRWEGSVTDNELSTETKAKWYNFIMSLILCKDKYNNDNKVLLMRRPNQFTHNATKFSRAYNYTKRTLLKTRNNDSCVTAKCQRFVQNLTV